MRQTPLFAEYPRHGAKVVDFHGWALPVQFSGIIQEHLHTREKAGLFDCSHMSEFFIEGAENIARFDYLVYSDYQGLGPGRCRYSAIMNKRGGLVDDCVALRLAEDVIYLVTNAGPHDDVVAHFAAYKVKARDVSEETAKIDLQGPLSRGILRELGIEAVAPLKFWQGVRTQWQGHELIVTRAGYTGELGYEIFLPAEAGPALWQALVSHPDVLPCGLGARDTLRLEVGYPLYGEDAGPEKSPLASGMGRFIHWEKDFLGKSALEKVRDEGDYSRLTAIVSADRRAPRHGFELKCAGVVVGEVTSGTYGPSVGRGVGLADLPADLSEPDIELTAGPRDLPVVTAEIPVYKDGTARKKLTG